MQQHTTHEHASCHHTTCSVHDDQVTCVALVPIFNHLDGEQMKEIHALTHSVSFKKGESVYQPGSPSDTLYIVSRGRVRIDRLSESGKEQLVRILNPGDFTGELALFSDRVHEAYATAMIDTDICLLKRQDLQGLMLKYPTIAMKILAEFSNRLDQSEKQTTRFATEHVESRLAHFLVESLDPQRKDQDIILPMSKKDLASYLGTTPETISRKLLEFEEAGLIKQKTNKRIQIVDEDGLLLL